MSQSYAEELTKIDLMHGFPSLLDKIGHTPLVKIQNLVENPLATILVKLEYLNPSGSIKDRIALHIVNDAEKKGLLKPGGTLIEGTSGNTGAAIAMIGAIRGYRVILVMPEKVSQEKKNALKAYGAEVIVTPTEAHHNSPDHYINKAKQLEAEIPMSFRVNQYDNLKNPEAHYLSTGPEIWADTNGMIDYFVASGSTGGSISGIGKYLKEKNSKIKVIMPDPVGSIYYDYFKTGNIPADGHCNYFLEGIGEDHIAGAMDFSVLDDVVKVTDKQAFEMARLLAKKEGMLVGGSSGANMWAALEIARNATIPTTIVTLLPDNGVKYLSKIFDDAWMQKKRINVGTMKFATKAIHTGYDPKEEKTGCMMPPIYMSSTYVQDFPGEDRGYDYTRAGNPNFTILEKILAALEGGEHATVFSSGLGALTALCGALTQGDRVLALEGVYGGTYRLLNSVFKKFGVDFELLKLSSFEDLERALARKPKLFLFETPTNPLLNVIDIEACAKIAKRHGVLTVVDNTFATPYFQNPLLYGADVVWHSTTKYMSGHSDVIGGALITNNGVLKQQFDFFRKSMGLNPSPFDVWLVTRGVKTLALRMERHAQNAAEVVAFLDGHPKVSKIYYPGLNSSPNYSIANKQMSGFGGMVSVEFNLSLESTKALVSSFSLFALAESLGGVESLVCHPATMTHVSIPTTEREKSGLSDNLVRFSVGIEDPKDLIDDLSQALEVLTSSKS